MRDTLHILLIEDNPGDARLIQEQLVESTSPPFHFERANRLSTGLERLDKGDIDVILLDLGLPESVGFDTFTRVHDQAPRVPIIVLTGLDDESLAVEAMRTGAQDYLVKGQVDGNLLARSIRYAVERAQAEEALHDKVITLETLAEIDRQVIAATEPQGILDLVCRRAAELVHAPKAAVGLVAPLTEAQMVTSYGLDDPGQTNQEFLLQLSTGALRSRMTSGPWVESNLPVEDPHMPEFRARENIHAYVIAPLIASEQMLGVLAVFDTAPHMWSQDEIQVLSLLAGQAAIALVKARLFEAARSRALHLASLNEIGQAIASTLDLDCVLRTLLEHIRQVTDAEACSVALVEPPSQPSPVFDGGEQGGCLVFRQAVGEVGPAVTGLRLKLGQGIAGWVAAHRQPTLVPDVTSDPRFHSEVDRNTGFITRDLVCVPLIVRDTVTGVLELINKHTGKFNEDEVRLLESVATQAAVAIENARLFQETRRRLNEMAVVSNVALVGAAGRPFDEAVASAVNALSSLWPDSKIGFLFVDETEQMLRAHPFSQYTQPEAAASLSIPLGQGITGWAARERQPVRVGDTSRDPRSAVAVPDIVSEMVAPMVVGERMIGVVSVVSSQLDAFSGDDLRLLTTLAGQLATIFEKARLDAKLAEHAATLEQQVQERTAQVQAQYARLRAILNSTSDGIIVTDTEGEILQANLVATRWLAQTLSVEDARRLREQVRSLAMRSGERPESVLELTGLDLQLHSAPIRDPQIERGAVVAVQDVSHLKALDRMKSRFVSNVSHELRTPLTAIKLCVTMLRTSPPEKQDKYLNMLEQEVDRQARLVEDVLQISRIEAGRFELQLRPVALHELAEAAVASRQMLAASRGLALEDHSDEPGPIVLVDPERMMEVVNNLVENAIRYTPEGGKIALSTGREQAGERLWAKLSVADTGIGIPEEELPYVFDRFFRGEKPQAMQIPGTGLGLSIVKEIAEMHGGQVTVQSRVGQGTLFAVWLPFVE